MNDNMDNLPRLGQFFDDIEHFNAMYNLPMPPVPTLLYQRIEAFQDIIQEEVNEGVEIINADNKRAELGQPELSVILTMLADWLGDMTIYCVSEMHRYGLDPEKVLEIIMQSNFSKLGADGLPIYDSRGKVMKGPGYWKPEPKLKEYIESKMVTLKGE